MPQMVKAVCPGCQNVLRIPADWISRSVRCKRCGCGFVVKGKSAGASPPAVPVATSGSGGRAPRHPKGSDPASAGHVAQENALQAGQGRRPHMPPQALPAPPAQSRWSGSLWKGASVGVGVLVVTCVATVLAWPWLSALMKPPPAVPPPIVSDAGPAVTQSKPPVKKDDPGSASKPPDKAPEQTTKSLDPNPKNPEKTVKPSPPAKKPVDNAPVKPAPEPIKKPEPPLDPDMADPRLVQAIFDELNVPVIRGESSLRDFVPSPFSTKNLVDYKRPAGKSPLQEATEKARNLMRRQQFEIDRLRIEYPALPNETRFKQQILVDEEKVAGLMGTLNDALDDLKKAGDSRGQESSKRYQANYDYILARSQAPVGVPLGIQLSPRTDAQGIAAAREGPQRLAHDAAKEPAGRQSRQGPGQECQEDPRQARPGQPRHPLGGARPPRQLDVAGPRMAVRQGAWALTEPRWAAVS